MSQECLDKLPPSESVDGGGGGGALDAVLGGRASTNSGSVADANESSRKDSVGTKRETQNGSYGASATEEEEEDARQDLFGGSMQDNKSDGVKHASSAEEERRQQQDSREKQSQRVKQVLADTRRRMAERQEQAEEVRDKASRLNAGAEDFASLATKLRKQQEADKCVLS
jgi:hypothetical protein